MDMQMYTYKAKLIKVVDGDTVDFSLDLGMSIYSKQRIRLLGINSPEMRGENKEDGKAAKAHIIDMLNKEGDIVVKTEKQGKYGRYLGTIYLNGTDINQQMINDGFAVEYMK